MGASRLAVAVLCAVLAVGACGGDDDDDGVDISFGDEPPALGDHWHAAFGVNVCGEWLANAPEFHNAADDLSLQAGVHSHGDGLVHIHPFVSGEAGANATMGKFFEYGGWSAGADSFEVWDGAVHQSGDLCDGQAAVVSWTLNGEAQDGDITAHRLADGDVIALALIPEGDEVGRPPSAADLDAPSDLAPATSAPD
ncbi:MAG: hypothetical protein SGJ13_18155 [Actinomycetota bacterium]|nr:hypothetical protein [Actinomycetota bacterium]